MSSLSTYHSDAVLGEDLLGWDVEGDGPEVDGLDGVQAGQDEEEAGTDSSALLDLPQPEYDGPLVLLDLLHGHEQGEGEGADDEEHGEDPEEALDTGPAAGLFLLHRAHNDPLVIFTLERVASESDLQYIVSTTNLAY